MTDRKGVRRPVPGNSDASPRAQTFWAIATLAIMTLLITCVLLVVIASRLL